MSLPLPLVVRTVLLATDLSFNSVLDAGRSKAPTRPILTRSTPIRLKANCNLLNLFPVIQIDRSTFVSGTRDRDCNVDYKNCNYYYTYLKVTKAIVQKCSDFGIARLANGSRDHVNLLWKNTLDY